MRSGEKRRWSRWHWAAAACAALFLFSGVMLIRDLAQSAGEQEANRRLSQRVREERTAAAPSVPAPPSPAADAPEPVPQYAPSGNLLAYDGLWQENNDLAGWLTIAELDIDLPVMYTPSDTEYYLHRAFDGSYAASGSLFLGEGWAADANHAIVYGHNMKNGTMFGELDRYQSLEYARDHPDIRFDTLREERTYTVLAAFYSRAYGPGDTDAFRYYQYTDLSDEETFEEYLAQVRSAALYDTGADVQFGDRLLTLTTCSYHRKNGRFVVVACQRAGG